MLPLDQVCVDSITTVMAADKWTAYNKRVLDYYQFPKEDFEKFFSTPVLLEAAKDKVAADAETPASKRCFPDKTRETLETTLK